MRAYHLIRGFILSVLSKKTVGVRMLLMQDKKVLLVKHSYQQGWYTIGGGVEKGETPLEAMKRELKEEVGATLLNEPQLFSVYHSRNEKPDDYIIFYVAEGCEQEVVHSDEITEQRWFPLDALPEDATPATRRRIQEYLGEKTIDERW
jgi:8-oxo-dGTP pyrophosphatase MutT (NUDIX family)